MRLNQRFIGKRTPGSDAANRFGVNGFGQISDLLSSHEQARNVWAEDKEMRLGTYPRKQGNDKPDDR